MPLICVCESFPSVMFFEPTEVPSALRRVTVTSVVPVAFVDRRKRFVRYPLGGVVDGEAEMYGTYAVSPSATTWSWFWDGIAKPFVPGVPNWSFAFTTRVGERTQTPAGAGFRPPPGTTDSTRMPPAPAVPNVEARTSSRGSVEFPGTVTTTFGAPLLSPSALFVGSSGVCGRKYKSTSAAAALGFTMRRDVT